MDIESAGGIKAAMVGNRILLSGTRRPGITVTAQGASDHPLAGMGFFASDAGNGIVRVAPGFMRIPLDGTLPYGGFANVLSGDSEVGDPIYCTGFTAATSGYLLLKFGRSVASLRGVERTAYADFGDPSNPQYFFTERPLLESLDGYADVEYPPGVFNLDYAIVFVATLPAPSSDFFRRVICRIEVSASGAITLHQVHIGDILVPHGLFGKISQITVGAAD